MKRIVLLAYHYPGFSPRGGERARALAQSMRRLGFNVTVVVATTGRELFTPELIAVRDPSRNCRRRNLRQRATWLGWRLLQELLNRIGIGFSLLSAWKRRARKKIGQLFEEGESGVLIASYPPLEALELGLELQSGSGWPLIADFRDGLLFEPVEKRRLERLRAFAARAKNTERKIAAQSAAIVTVSPPISDYFEKEYGCGRVVTLPNGFVDEEPSGRALPEIFAGSAFNLVYTGSLGVSREGVDIFPLLKLIREINRESLSRPLTLHLAGMLRRGERKVLEPFLADKTLVFHGFLERAGALAMQRAADLLLLVTSSGVSSVATGKLFEYLAASRPVLHIGSGNYASQILEQTGAGWSFQRCDGRLRRFLLEAVSGKLPPSGRNEGAIREFSWEKLAARWEELLAEVQSLN